MKKVVLFAMLLSVMGVKFSYAVETETDMFGNPIDWIETNGGEDNAGYETEPDLLPPPTMDESEAEEVEEIIEAYETETTVTNEMGALSVIFEAPDGWGYNIELKLYDENMQPVKLICYRQNDFIAKAELPAGHYQLYKASVVGDLDNRYPLMASESEIDISEEHAVTVYIEHAETSMEESIAEELTEESTTAFETGKETMQIGERKAFAGKVLIGVVLGTALLGSAFLYSITRKIKKGGRE